MILQCLDFLLETADWLSLHLMTVVDYVRFFILLFERLLLGSGLAAKFTLLRGIDSLRVLLQ